MIDSDKKFSIWCLSFLIVTNSSLIFNQKILDIMFYFMNKNLSLTKIFIIEKKKFSLKDSKTLKIMKIN